MSMQFNKNISFFLNNKRSCLLIRYLFMYLASQTVTSLQIHPVTFHPSSHPCPSTHIIYSTLVHLPFHLIFSHSFHMNKSSDSVAFEHIKHIQNLPKTLSLLSHTSNNSSHCWNPRLILPSFHIQVSLVYLSVDMVLLSCSALLIDVLTILHFIHY